MARRDGRTKTARAKFFRDLCALVESLDAVAIDRSPGSTITGPMSRYRIDTIHGGLEVSVYDTWVATCFDDPKRGIGNQHSGKWNHHWFGNPVPVDEAIADISKSLSAIAITGPGAVKRIREAIAKDEEDLRAWGKALYAAQLSPARSSQTG